MPPQLLDGMKKEAYARTAILLSEQMDSAATSLAREIKMTANPIKNPLSDQQTIPSPMTVDEARTFQAEVTKFRRDAVASKIEAYRTLFGQMKDHMAILRRATTTGETVYGYSTFSSAIESPVRWDTSKIELVNRASDSMTIGSQYISVQVVDQQESVKTSASSTKTSASYSEGIMGLMGASFSTALDTAAQSRIAEARTTKSIETTLVVSSFATHRKVKQFAKLNLDASILRQGFNFFHPTKEVPSPIASPLEFQEELYDALTKGQRQQPQTGAPLTPEEKVAIVTEVFQGSALVGFVHFIKREQTTKSENYKASAVDARATMEYSDFLSSMTGSTSFSMEQATNLAKLASEAGLQIEFDLICHGYIPAVKSQIVETTVQEISHTNVNDQTATQDGSKGQGEKQSNANSVITGTIDAVNEIVTKNPVLGIQTFMDAFDDYSKAAQGRPDEIGAPIGMNVREFSRAEILMQLATETAGGVPPAAALKKAIDKGRKEQQNQDGSDSSNSSGGSGASLLERTQAAAGI